VKVTTYDSYQGEYRLRVSTATPPAQLEIEPNDAIATATLLTLSNSDNVTFGNAIGQMLIPGDVDYYSLGTVEAGKTIYLTATKPGDSSVEPVVGIYGTGNVYVPEAGSGRPFDRVAEVQITQTGTYFARVSNQNSGGGLLARYSLNVQIQPTGSQSFPNLQTESVSLPPETGIVSGQSISVSYTVKNVGSRATVESAWNDRVVLSTNAILGDGDDMSLGIFPHYGNLNPGSSYTVNQTVQLPDGINGDYYLIVESDSGNAVTEFLLEGDNATASNGTFHCSLAPPKAVTPAAAPPPGLYDSAINANLTSLTQGAVIHYTLDGGDPTEASEVASRPIALGSGTQTLKARAFASGISPSTVFSGVYRIDGSAPTLSAPRFNSTELSSGLVVTAAGTLSIVASDDLSGVNRVEVLVNDQTLGATSVNAGGRYSVPWNISGANPDGTYSVKFRAYDNLGKVSEQVIGVNLALARPPAPSITAPANNAQIAADSVLVQGTAAVGSQVSLYRGSILVASGISVQANGHFEFNALLDPGAQTFTAKAAYRPGEPGAASDPRTVIRDESVPTAPPSMTTTSLAGGRIRIEWMASSSSNVIGYNIFRSTSPFSAANPGLQINSSPITALFYIDTPPAGFAYYYRVVPVSGAGISGTSSSSSSSQADATPPSAVAIWTADTSAVDATSGAFGVGRIHVRITASEKLQATPFLTIQPSGGIPSPVSLVPDPVDPLVFTGEFEVAANTPSGNASVSFVGRDLAGNRGVELGQGATMGIDTAPPAVISSNFPEAIKNSPTSTLNFELELNEPALTDPAPTLLYTLSASHPQSQTISLQEVPNSDGKKWTGSLALPADAGAQPEDLAFTLSAKDALGNQGGSFSVPSSIFVYQELPGLAPPVLKAVSAPNGAINLSWNSVSNASEYVLYHGQSANPDDLVELATVPATQTTFSQTPASDGTYYFAIAARRNLNGESSALVLSNPVSAISDRVPPDPPQNLALSLSGQGISATWDPPQTTEPLLYQLLRSSSLPVTLEARIVGDHISSTQSLDAAPTSAETHYAVVTLDAAGNRSQPSTAATLNAALYPPSTLAISTDLDGKSPVVLQWTQTGAYSGHKILVGNSDPLELIGSVANGINTFSDAPYNQASRRYVIETMDADGNSSPPKALVLPGIKVDLEPGQTLGRGIMNRLRFTVTNLTQDAIANAVLISEVSGHQNSSSAFQLPAGAAVSVDVFVPGYSELTDSAALKVAFRVEPSPGTTATLNTSFTVPVIEKAIPVTLHVHDLLRGGDTGRASFTVENPGADPIEIILAKNQGAKDSPDVRFRIKDSSVNSVAVVPVRTLTGSGVTNLSDGTTVLRIPAGESVTSPEFTIPVPLSAPTDVAFSLEIDRMWFHYGSPDATELPLNLVRTLNVSTLEPPYTAHVDSVTPAISQGSEPVLISGTTALRGGGGPAAGQPVDVTIARGTYTRTLEVVSGADGTFTLPFVLGAGEPGGTFQVWAHHPDQTAVNPQMEFTVSRINATPAAINWTAPRNYKQNLSVQLSTAGGTATNVHAELAAEDQPDGSLPPGISFQSSNVTNLTSTATLTLTLQSDNTAPSSGKLVVRLVSDGTAPLGFQKIAINYSLSDAKPSIVATPQSLSTGVNPGKSLSEAITIKNEGLAPLMGASWQILNQDGTAAPSWVSQVTDAAIGQLDPGASAELRMDFSPPSSETEGDHYLKVVVRGDNTGPLEFPLHLAVTSGNTGNFVLRAIDANTGGSISGGLVGGVSGASVRLQNANVSSISYEAVTNSDGEIGENGSGLAGIPEGLYDLTITKSGHLPYRSSIWIRPGGTASELAVLQLETVNVTWEVTETTLHDSYQVVANVNWETNVNVPVLVATPAAINLPPLEEGEVYSGEITIQNHGAIPPKETKLVPPADDSYFHYEILPNSSAVAETSAPSSGSTAPSSDGGGTITNASPSLSSSAVAETDAPSSDSSTTSSGGGVTSTNASSAVLLSVPPNEEVHLPIKITALRKFDGCTYSKFFNGTAITVCPNGTIHTQNFSIGIFCKGPNCPSTASSPAQVIAGGIASSGGVTTGWQPAPLPMTDDCFDPLYRAGAGGPCSEGNLDSVGGADVGDTTGGGLAGSNSGAISPASSSVDLINREYLDGREDLTVAVPGGQVILRRDFYGKDWHFAHEQRLTFVSSTDGSETISILRHRVPYAFSDVAHTRFASENYAIVKEVSGSTVTWRWSSPTGAWERYDSAGRLIESGSRDRRTLVVYYAPGADHPAELRDTNGRTIISLVYENGRLKSASDLAGRSVSYQWENNQLTGFTDAENHLMSMSYGTDGRMTGKVDRNGQSITITYTPAGFVSGVLGGEHGDQLYSFSYNGSTRTHYARVSYAGGRIVEAWYDGDGELIKKAENGTTLLTRVRSGRTITETDALSRTTTREYDSFNNLIRQIDPDGRTQSWEYEPIYQQPLRHTDARGVVTSYSYYPDTHRLHEVVRGAGTTVAQTTQYEWDASGRLEKMTDPIGMVTKLTYYAVNDLLHESTRGFGTPQAQTTTQTYDDVGNMETLTDALGHETDFEHDKLRRLRKITNALHEESIFDYTGTQLTRVETGRTSSQPGRALRRAYDERGRFVAEYLVGTDGNEILQRSMTLDGEGRVLTVTNALGQVVQTHGYDAFGRETSVSTPNTLGGLATASTEYDVMGRVTATVSAEGVRKEILYDAGDRPVKITEAPGTALERVTNRIYDSHGDLVEEQFPTSTATYVTHYAYDALGRRTSVSGDRAETFSYTYDGLDHVLTSTDGRSNTTVFAYDILGRLATTTLPPVPESPVAITTYGYDAENNLVSQQDGDGRTIGYAYDALSRRVARSIPVQGALAAAWEEQPSLIAEKTTYDNLGEVTSMSAPASAIASGAAGDANATELHYDAFGRVWQRVAHTGPGKTLTSTMVYSLVGQPLSTSTEGTGISASQSTIWSYDPANPALVSSVTNPSGLKITYTYDGANRVATAVTSTGATESWGYDSLSRIQQHTVSAPDAAAQVSLFEYNRFDQPSFLTLPGHTEQKPRTETRTYDAKGHLATQSGPATYALTYEYDDSGNLALMRDANSSETRWTYDARNRLAEKRYSDGKTWQFTHDAAGNLKTRTDALSRTTSYIYNAFGRISNIDYPNDHDVVFGYDAAGRLTSVTDGTGVSTWTPDAWDRTSACTQPLTARALTYTYNAGGQRESLAFSGTSQPARTVTYQYDSISRLSSLADSVTGGSFVYSYQPGTSWVSRIETPSGSATTNVRDSLGRVTGTAFVDAGDTSLNSFAYTYDAAGQRSTEVSARGDITFAYNRIGELIGAAGFASGDYSYAYDGIGNRLSASDPGAPASYTPNALNQYAEITRSGVTVHPSYDENGNLISNGEGTSFTYDDENRLTAMVKGTKRSEFVYDGLSRRVETRELENGTRVKTVRYVYDGQVPTEELEWNGAATGAPARWRQITRGPDLSGRLQDAGGIGGLLAFTSEGESAWYFSDANGNVANLFTSADTAAAAYTYDPFGRRLTASGTLATANAYQWSGKEYHEPSGLVYYLYRFYDPQNGRWLNHDPLGEEGGVNLYGFVGNDPINYVDSDGREWFGAGVGFFVGGIIGAYTGGWKGAISGAIGGLVTGLTFNPELGYLTAGALSGALGAAATDLTHQALDNATGCRQGFDLGEFARATGIGFVGGAVIGKVTGLASPWLGKLLGNWLNKAETGAVTAAEDVAPTVISDSFVAVKPLAADAAPTGYRLVSSDAPYLPELLKTGRIPANPRGTYFSYDNLGDALGSFRAQIPHDGNIMVEFDTAQLGSDIKVPLGNWGNGPHLEPVARDFPDFGFGGASQRTTTSEINATRIIDRRTGEILYERK
jgi:RHS repeat-associated protein